MTGYVIVYLSKKKERIKNKAKSKVVRFLAYMGNDEDECAHVMEKGQYSHTKVFTDHFAKGETQAQWKYEEFYKPNVTIHEFSKYGGTKHKHNPVFDRRPDSMYH